MFCPPPRIHPAPAPVCRDERFRDDEDYPVQHYRSAMAVLFVYDVTNENSFENIKTWIKEIELHGGADAEKIILGNKCDMEDKRKVTKEQGEQLAKQYNVKFMETSAMNGTNVEQAFTEMASDINDKMLRRMDQREISGGGRSRGKTITPITMMSAKERKRHEADEKKRREHEAAAAEKALSAEKERLVQEAAAAKAAEQKRRQQTAAAAAAKARFVTALVAFSPCPTCSHIICATPPDHVAPAHTTPRCCAPLCPTQQDLLLSSNPRKRKQGANVFAALPYELISPVLTDLGKRLQSASGWAAAAAALEALPGPIRETAIRQYLAVLFETPASALAEAPTLFESLEAERLLVSFREQLRPVFAAELRATLNTTAALPKTDSRTCGTITWIEPTPTSTPPASRTSTPWFLASLCRARVRCSAWRARARSRYGCSRSSTRSTTRFGSSVAQRASTWRSRS